jgi:hypothetical protein
MTMKAVRPVTEDELAALPPQHRRTSVRAGSDDRSAGREGRKSVGHDRSVDQREIGVD